MSPQQDQQQQHQQMHHAQQHQNKIITVPSGQCDDTTKNTTPSAGGEYVVTIASAILLFCHFGITLYKIERTTSTDGEHHVSVGKQRLKDRWLLINICILVFAFASHLYRQALANLNIKFPLLILIPDLCTTGVIILNLTKHVYFALYLLMAGVTFLSVSVSVCDLYAYCFPSKTVYGGTSSSATCSSASIFMSLSPGKDMKKGDDDDFSVTSMSSLSPHKGGSRSRLSSYDDGSDMDGSGRSVNSASSVRSSGSWISQRNILMKNTAQNASPIPKASTNSNSNSNSSSLSNTKGPGRKKATRSILNRGNVV